MIRHLMVFILVMACLTLSWPLSGAATTAELSEHEVKAAYLYNFAKYVEWPTAAHPRDDANLIIVIAGRSPLNDVIELLAGKTVKGHRLVIRHYSRAEDLNECQILFINASMKASLSSILAAAASRSILTVSDSRGFAAAGGIVEFVPVGNTIRFAINNRAAQHVKLRISSHLLRLATTVLE